jgi:hypothetical protein
MEQYSKIKEKYFDIIEKTLYMTPENYEVICFDKYINTLFPKSDAFISSEQIVNIRYLLKQIFGNDTKCLYENGRLEKVRFDELKYYQLTVGIEGPKHTRIEEPVHVINHNDQLILLNGYHRAFHKLINNCTEIDAYVLKI